MISIQSLPPRYRGRTTFLVVSGVVATVILVASRAVLLPFVVALLLAYLLTPLVAWFEKFRIHRGFGVVLVYTLFLGSLAGFFWGIVPRLIVETQKLALEVPKMKTKALVEWAPIVDERMSQWTSGAFARSKGEEVHHDDADAPKVSALYIRKTGSETFEVELEPTLQLRHGNKGEFKFSSSATPDAKLAFSTVLVQGLDKAGEGFRQNASELLRIGQEVVQSVSRGIFNFFLTLMLAAYLIITREKIFRFFRDLIPSEDREGFDRFFRRLDRGLAGVVRGQLTICLVNGVLTAIGLAIFNVKYWPLLSLLATVFSIIPIFGAILSSVPAVAIGLTQSFATAALVLGWIVLIHQIEANLLNPKIIGDSAKIHPVLVVLALLIGEHFFQITGALFAVPVLSIVQTLFLHFRESTLGLAHPLASMVPQGPDGPGGIPESGPR